MEIILSVLFILGIWVYFKTQETKACNYSQSHQIDWGTVNSDRVLNDLSNSQVNQNIISGKYNVHSINKNNTWEEFKRKHPHGSWN